MVKIGNNNFLMIEEIAEGFNVEIEKVYDTLKKYNINSIQFDEKVYVLETEFLRIFTGGGATEQVNVHQKINKKYPVTERQILTETVNLLRYTGQLSIKQLREKLKETMELSEEDLQINKGRSDTKFDQKVRNLISHRKSNGLIDYCEYKKIGKEGFLKLKGGISE